ncbi:MAG: hypothetical protein AAGF01_23215 [Cyanobacteria bacterium P01_G01_bin.38]
MQTVSSPLSDLLLQAGLLAGLGSQARPVAQALGLKTGPADGVPQKSCISAGNSLMLSLLAPAERSLRVSQRLDHRWLQTYYPPGEHTGGDSPPEEPHQRTRDTPERWLTEFFFDQFGLEPGKAHSPWSIVLELAHALKAETPAQRYHRILGPRGRLLSLSHRLDSAQAGGWVTWQLDRHTSPEAALDACDVGWAWPIAAQHLKTLLGRSVSKYCRPWSLAWEISSDRPRFRLGTTVWARQAETAEKHRRLAATVAQMGGDSRFAEALYKLIAATHPVGFTHRIGRAVEIEFDDGQAVALEFFLCVATP